MKIAVTGAKGQLGSELVRQGCIPLQGRLPFTETQTEIKAMNPYAIINCAAMTNVDGCENRVDAACFTNTNCVDWLSLWFKGYLVQISTDYIFDGLSGPYSPNDAPNPLSIYGWSKLGGELIARRHREPWLIIRTTILFSQSTNNFVYKIVKQLEQGKKVMMYQPGLIGTPTYVPDLAKEVIRIVKAEYTGVAHIAGNRSMTRLFFAQMIAQAFGFNSDDIVPVDGKPTGAPRPPIAGLVCDHSGYSPVNGHSAKEGLWELAGKYKRGEIWK